MTVSGPMVLVGVIGTSLMSFTLMPCTTLLRSFTVAFSNANVTAVGSDYAVTTASPLTFVGTAGETQTISVKVRRGTRLDSNDTITFNPGSVAGTTATQATPITTGAVGTGTITN